MNYFEIPITRTVKTTVIIRAERAEDITPKIISAAIVATVAPDEWEALSESTGKPSPIPAETAEEFHCYETGPARKSGRQTLTHRAAETGLSRQTLANWEADGIEIFDDTAIRKKIGTLRHLPQITKRFQMRLSDSVTVE